MEQSNIPRSNDQGQDFVLCTPVSFEESENILRHLERRTRVVLNLSTNPDGISQRILDFVGGAIYAVGGTIKKVTNNIYIITPNPFDTFTHEENGYVATGSEFMNIESL